MAHLSSNQYGQSSFLSSKICFSPKEGRDGSFQQVNKLQTGRACFCRDPNGDRSDSWRVLPDNIIILTFTSSEHCLLTQLHFQVQQEVSRLFLLEKRAQSIFRERGVAACLILLMEQLMEGSSLRVYFHIFGTFSRRSAASVISLSALYTEAATLFLCRAAGSHHDFAFASLIFILYNCTVCFVSVCST